MTSRCSALLASFPSNRRNFRDRNQWIISTSTSLPMPNSHSRKTSTLHRHLHRPSALRSISLGPHRRHGSRDRPRRERLCVVFISMSMNDGSAYFGWRRYDLTKFWAELVQHLQGVGGLLPYGRLDGSGGYLGSQINGLQEELLAASFITGNETVQDWNFDGQFSF